MSTLLNSAAITYNIDINLSVEKLNFKQWFILSFCKPRVDQLDEEQLTGTASIYGHRKINKNHLGLNLAMVNLSALCGSL